MYANDYYYSDIRAFIKQNLLTKLNIDTSGKAYKAIIERTILNLYDNNQFLGWKSLEYKYNNISSLTLPSGADETESDKFWLLSIDELQNFFDRSTTENSSTDRQWINQSNGVAFWSRLSGSDYTYAKVMQIKTADYCIRLLAFFAACALRAKL